MSPAFLNILERSYAETFFQSLNALLAASKAISKSSFLACETLPITSSVAGFMISNVSFDKELERVIYHGVLHLCGYNDKTDIEIQKMREKEKKKEISLL